MKKLKFDFTTPEQSKRLLELGVPRESANVIYYHTPDGEYDPYIINDDLHIQNLKEGKGLPCWTGGRLYEIYTICRTDIFTLYGSVEQLSFINAMIFQIECALRDHIFDFSNLEE
jgi:hypothetical protein